MKIGLKSRRAFLGSLVVLPLLGLMPGCGGGGGGGGTASSPFAGTYRGVYYVTAGPEQNDARFLDFNVQQDGRVGTQAGPLNAPQARIANNGIIDFTVDEGNGVTTRARGQLRPEGTGTIVTNSSNGNVTVISVARRTGITDSFAGNYFGTARVRSGTGIGTVEAATVSVNATGAATVVLTNADNTSRIATGTANLTTGALTVTGGTGAGAITFTLQLSRSGQASGIFETADSRGTVALNKV
jgi:hypothetical protein